MKVSVSYLQRHQARGSSWMWVVMARCLMRDLGWREGGRERVTRSKGTEAGGEGRGEEHRAAALCRDIWK